MIQIHFEKGIPIPKPKPGRGQGDAIPYPTDWPVRFKVQCPDLRTMEVGDSLFFPGLAKVIWPSVIGRFKRRRIKHAARTYHGPEWGVRVWRTA